MSSFQDFINVTVAAYQASKTDFVLDVIYVAPRDSIKFDVVNILNTHQDPTRYLHNWTLGASVDSMDRFFIKLARPVRSEAVYKYVKEALAGKPVDFVLKKCIYPPQL